MDYVNRAGALHGRAFAWTLNLAPDVEMAANDNQRGALDYLARRVRRHLDREPALDAVSLSAGVEYSLIMGIENSLTGSLA